MSKAIVFYNYSDEPFTGRWNSVDYPTVKPKKTIVLEEHLARHFATKLADREMIKLDLQPMRKTEEYKSFVMKAMLEEEVEEAENEEVLKVKIDNKKPKKTTKKVEAKEEEVEEFVD